MKDLLNTYSVDEIVMFIVLLSAAVKGVITWIDWAKDKINKHAGKLNEQEAMKKSIDDLTQEQKSMKNEIEGCQIQIKNTIADIQKSVNLLEASDRDDIKAWITEKHHYFCYQVGYIDDYSLDCIEKRYSHYKDEGGNSFIDELMEEIRALPKKSGICLKNENRE